MTDHLRRARVEDLPAIARGERSYMHEIEPQEEDAWAAAFDRLLTSWIARLDKTFVLEADGETAGYATWDAFGDRAVLVTIHVFDAFRRGGRGETLLKAYVNDARTFGFSRLTLGVFPGNPAQGLYEKHGFEYTHDDEHGYRQYALTLS